LRNALRCPACVKFIEPAGAVAQQPQIGQQPRAGYFQFCLRKTPFGCEALVTDRRAFAEKYPDIMLCNASVEDIIVFSSRGVK